LLGIILETERLILREFKLSDAQKFYELNSDWEVMKYTGEGEFNSVGAAEELIRNYSDYEKNGFGRNTVILKSLGEIIGWCGLKKHADGMIDLGYRLFKKDWNKGYAAESSRAIIGFGFLNYEIEEIVGRADEKNIASIRVLEKVGMKFWKKESCEGIEGSLYYRINQKEWQRINKEL